MFLYFFHSEIPCRTLFPAQSLRVDTYVRNKQRYLGTIDSRNSLKQKLFKEEFKKLLDDDKKFVKSSSFNTLIHIVDNKPEDLELVVRGLRKLREYQRHVGLVEYEFGPIVMRMFHHLNLPDSALQCVNDPTVSDYFTSFAANTVLADLLYENQRYQDVLNLLESITKTPNFYPKAVVAIASVACCKMVSTIGQAPSPILLNSVIHLEHTSCIELCEKSGPEVF